MAALSVLLFFVALGSFILLIVGLIKPSSIKLKKDGLPIFPTRKRVALVMGGTLIVSVVLGAVFSSQTEVSTKQQPQQPQKEEIVKEQQTQEQAKQIIIDLVDASRGFHVGNPLYEDVRGAYLDLQTFSNPKGEGTIVAAQDGLWIWLVSDNGTVYAVNGTARTLTPGIEFSSEHPSKIKVFEASDLIKK